MNDKQLDLDGNELEPVKIKIIRGKYKIFKSINNYRKSYLKTKQCGACNYCRCKRYYKKNYYKCLLMGNSNSESSDIRKSYICNKYELKEDK